MRKLILRILCSWPFQQAVKARDFLAYYFSAYCQYCRIKYMFPEAVDLIFDKSTTFKYCENIVLGARVKIGPRACIGAYGDPGSIILEDDVRISQGVIIESASLDIRKEFPYRHVSKPILIKKGAWIGSNAIILGGVTVGERAVIGAGAVIAKDVPDRAIVVGPSNRIVGFLE